MFSFIRKKKNLQPKVYMVTRLLQTIITDNGDEINFEPGCYIMWGYDSEEVARKEAAKYNTCVCVASGLKAIE